MMEWLQEVCCLANEKQNASETKARGRLRQSAVFFPLADHSTVVHHVMSLQAFILAFS